MTERARETGRPREAGQWGAPLPDAVLDAHGLTCGQLEPLIAQRLRTLAAGQVLEVRSDLPAAEEGIGAWSWLSGNALVAVVRDEPPLARYYVRRKSG